MSILIGEATRVLVQGITGNEGRFHTQQMLEYGTNVVAGVTPGKGGQDVEGVPVFDTVSEGVDATGANASILFVPVSYTRGKLVGGFRGAPRSGREVRPCRACARECFVG